MHRHAQEPVLLTALANAGFAEIFDWRPTRFVVGDASGREIDLHTLVFAPDGSAVQASLEPESLFVHPVGCFVTGTIQHSTVPCLSAEQQVYFYQGYDPADRDRHGMTRFREAFGITTHF
ncbi:nucleotidyltransferase domain-containing protein [Streptomyces sp. NPDC058623]|uniref:nucleotidyltransferase domain-containing protein n=1 Tax=Streptomyces sp. NPDC058623 TaxID=3346563 RepID=UPI00365024CF